ncbi:membrane-associated tyrosine- and threonine-specific cdc2-inhibitory kinase wee-1.3-like [Asterias amurensis]|uniref:membrane-associated tyrosine- and threonine-specific cdc2-inhibitory kinase wee-1.3-like n=1 Tax=Asterias amurensis TaxID=7602 RepID=UPI003AB37C7D
MNRYTPVERICSGFFGPDHRVMERRGPGKKERRMKLVPCGSREFAMRALGVYKENIVFMLKHENIMKVKEAFLHKQQGTVYLCSVWKKYDSQTLNEFLIHKHKGMTDDSYKSLFVQLATGLSFLHSNGVAHNALTPFSVVMTEYHNGDGVAKLTDYGLSQLCLKAEGDKYAMEEGRSKSLTYALPPEAYNPNWAREFDKPSKPADIFMLGMLFNAAADHSFLHQTDKTKEPHLEVMATYLPFPGYGQVPVGKFMHNNPSVDLDHQLFRGVSPDLRRLLRRMALLEPESRPAPTGVLQMLNACKTLQKPRSILTTPTERDDNAPFKMPLAPLNSNRKRRSSSIRYDPMSSNKAKKNTMTAPASEWEKSSSQATSGLIRRASVRLSQRARSVSDYLNQKKSFKITD